jgi:outer membrane protein assembly factor BamB
VIYPRSIRSFVRILFLFLAMAACSGLRESDRYKKQADQLMAEGRLDEAVLTYRQALLSEPNDPDLLIGLGLALADQGRNRSAAEMLNRAALQKPNDIPLKNTISGLVTQPQDGLSLNLAWLVTPMDSEPIGAAVDSGIIFVVYSGGRLMALDQVSGRVIWDTQAPVELVSPPAADSHQVWVGAEDGTIFIYDATSGQMINSYATKGAVYAAPALTSALAFCPSSDGTIYALDRTRLEAVWKATIGDPLRASPLVSGQSVYLGSNNGRLYAFNAATGDRIWADGFLTQGAIESKPAAADGRILIGSGDGRIYALNAETGDEYWRFSTPDAIYAQPLVLGDQIIIASSGQVLASIQSTDGSPTWSLSFDRPITETPVFFKGRLYLVTRSDPRLFAVDNGTGTLLGELNTGDWMAGGPLATGTDLILFGKDGAVFLYR